MATKEETPCGEECSMHQISDTTKNIFGYITLKFLPIIMARNAK